MLIAVIASSLLVSCKKTSPNDNNNTSSQDTLTAGWTMSKINLQQFTDIHFVQENGIVVSRTDIYGSNDGGETWTQRSNYGTEAFFGIGDDGWRRSIGMDSAGNVIISQGLLNGGEKDSLALSHDSNHFTILPDSFNINDSWLSSNNVGFAITANDQDTSIHFLKTINGGTSWNTVSIIPRATLITNVGVTRLAFVNSQTGWVSTPYGLFKTTNGGLSWSLQYTPPGIITNLSAVDSYTCYIEFIAFRAWDEIGTISKTTDGGINWQVVFSVTTGPGTDPIQAFQFVNATTGYMARGTSIYKSTDGGINWDKEVSIHSSLCSFEDIYFTDANHGWACSTEGQIVRYLR